MNVSGFLIFTLVLVVVAVLFAFQSVKVVPQQTAWVVERLGKFHAVLTPGLNFIIPFIDRVAYRHSLKEIPLDTPSQVCITRDNTQLTVDGVLFFQVTDPQRAVLSKLSTFMPKPVDHAIRTSFRQVDQSARPLQPIPSNTQQSGLRTDRPEKPDAFGTSKFQHFQKPLCKPVVERKRFKQLFPSRQKRSAEAFLG